VLGNKKDPQQNKTNKKEKKPEAAAAAKDPNGAPSQAPAEKAPASSQPKADQSSPLGGILKRGAAPQAEVVTGLLGSVLGNKGIKRDLETRGGPLDILKTVTGILGSRAVPGPDAATKQLGKLNPKFGGAIEVAETPAESLEFTKRDETNTDVGGHGEGSPSTSNGGLSAGSSFSNSDDEEDTEVKKTKRDVVVEPSPLLERHNAVLETLMWKRFSVDDYQPGSSEIESLARSAAGNGNIEESLKKLASGGVWGGEEIAEKAHAHAEGAWEKWFSHAWGKAKRGLEKRLGVDKLLAPVTGILGGVTGGHRA
jgi:hypothetical protein